jgi:hypothetical protein
LNEPNACESRAAVWLYRIVISAAFVGFLGTGLSWIADATRFARQRPFNIAVMVAMIVALPAGVAYLRLNRASAPNRRHSIVRALVVLDAVLLLMLAILVVLFAIAMKDFD